MRNAIVVLSMLLGSIASATAQVSVNIGLPDVSIGINLPVYPQLVLVPGYPVYYAPQMDANYFFYDGMYWVYQEDNWYASSWYNGPWGLVSDDVVPLFILRVPVRYYRRPPVYFRGWSPGAAPRWGDHWGNAWEQRRSGWDNWNRNSVPQAAPLPVYQRQYSGNRYPREDQQQALQRQNYRYQPREATVQQYYQAHQTQSAVPSAPAASRPVRQSTAQPRAPAPPDQRAANRPASPPQSTATTARAQPPSSTATGTRAQPPRPESANTRGPAMAQAHPQQKGPAQLQEQQAKQGPAARPAAQQPREALAQRDLQKGPAARPAAQHPQQAVAERGQPAARPQGEEKAPQGKQPAQEAKQDPKKGPENGG